MDSYTVLQCAEICLVIILLQSTLTDGQAIGVNYGRVADNLPPPAEVAALYKAKGITHMRMFDAEATVIQAFANTGIEIIVGVPNDQLPAFAGSVDAAANWFTASILPYYPASKIKYISVGNEVLPGTPFAGNVFPAMQNLYSAIQSQNLADRIKVSTTIPMSALSNSYPPSAGSFSPEITPIIQPMLNFLSQTKAPYMANVYPYFAYIGNTKDISLDYALFSPSTTPFIDGDLIYHNLYDAIVDSIISALEALGITDIPVIVTETGWPSAGNDAATIENAQTYNSNLVKHILSNAGTPKRPMQTMEGYVFAMFNEDLKSGDITEQHFGLFYPDKTEVYPVSFTLNATPSSIGISMIGGYEFSDIIE